MNSKRNLINHISAHGVNMPWKKLAKKFKIRDKRGNISWQSAVGTWSNHLRKTMKRTPKILIYDIEISLMELYGFGIWGQNFNVMNGSVQHDQFLLCWSAKWLHHSKIMSDCVTSQEALDKDDIRVANSLHKLLNEADIVVAHYGDKFDLPWMRTCFLKHNLNPISSLQSIDTLKSAKKILRFKSNKLDYIAKSLGLEGKFETGFQLWVRCQKGDPEALRSMTEYCDQDVLVLEKVYLKLRPYIRPHPNVALFYQDASHRCPTCGSDDLAWEQNGKPHEYNTGTNIFPAFQCNSCTSFGRLKGTKITKIVRDTLARSLPR